jgi:hypothetical protein
MSYLRQKYLGNSSLRLVIKENEKKRTPLHNKIPVPL